MRDRFDNSTQDMNIKRFIPIKWNTKGKCHKHTSSYMKPQFFMLLRFIIIKLNLLTPFRMRGIFN